MCSPIHDIPLLSYSFICNNSFYSKNSATFLMSMNDVLVIVTNNYFCLIVSKTHQEIHETITSDELANSHRNPPK